MSDAWYTANHFIAVLGLYDNTISHERRAMLTIVSFPFNSDMATTQRRNMRVLIICAQGRHLLITNGDFNIL